jgi:ubiquinone/menaquinone biosynthesis C-methylase UbiE
MPSKKSFHPTTRFLNRVNDYIKYRPTYPAELIQFLTNTLGCWPGCRVVDVGSGTGIFSELLLNAGAKVTGVEPNAEMRAAAESMLAKYADFTSVNGTAEKTSLPDASADMIVAAQAYHWFEPQVTRHEFQRILKPGGYAVLIWNDRKTTNSLFATEYENFIKRFNIDYQQVNHKNLDENEIRQFLSADGYGKMSFYNDQELDYEGLLGRLTSSSYMPGIDHPKYAELAQALRELFDQHQINGKVRIEYDCKVYYGKLSG